MSIDNVLDVTPRVQYIAATSQTAFAYPFPIFQNADLIVDVNGVTQALGTHYNVTGAGADTGGTVTFLSAPGVNKIVTIYRDIPIERTTDFQTNGPLRSATFNDELDRIALIQQQLEVQSARSLRMSPLDTSDDDDLVLPAQEDRAGNYLAFDAEGQPTMSVGTGTDASLRTDLASSVVSNDGARLIGYRRTEAGSVARAVASVLRHEVWIEDFGGAPGAGDNSAAFNAALTALIAIGGGKLRFGTVGEWRMNVTVAADNIIVSMPKGRPEFDVNCIRPFNIATGPAITFGNGTTDYRYCGLENVSMSGTDGTAGADVQSAKGASHCLLLKGGLVGFLALNSYFYNGIRTVSLEPTATNPVTGARFIGGGARNDLTDSDNARTLYGIRHVDPGFYTDNVFSHFKLNGPGAAGATTRGYLAEFDGTAIGMAAEFDYCYADFKADFAAPTTVCHGVLLKGGAVIRSDGLTLDPGANGVPIIESDQALTDIGRIIVGNLRQGGQRVKFAGGAFVDIPSEADSFSYKHRLYTPTLVGARSLTIHGAATAYPTTVQWELQSTTGPERLTGADLEVKKDVRVWGSNAALSGIISAVGAGGGLFLSAQGTNQNVRLVPSGTGTVAIDGPDIHPTVDNATSCGNASARWSVVYAATGAINTSDERTKQDIEPIPQAWLDAWGEVEWQRYRFKDAVAAKGDGARWHVGLIAQRVMEAFARRGLDAQAIGLICYDQWDDEFEDEYEMRTRTLIERSAAADGEIIDKAVEIQERVATGKKVLTRSAGNRYGIRYEEALALEAAYVRSRLATSATTPSGA